MACRHIDAEFGVSLMRKYFMACVGYCYRGAVDGVI